jgi:hypothetical protein
MQTNASIRAQHENDNQTEENKLHAGKLGQSHVSNFGKRKNGTNTRKRHLKKSSKYQKASKSHKAPKSSKKSSKSGKSSKKSKKSKKGKGYTTNTPTSTPTKKRSSKIPNSSKSPEGELELGLMKSSKEPGSTKAPKSSRYPKSSRDPRSSKVPKSSKPPKSSQGPKISNSSTKAPLDDVSPKKRSSAAPYHSKQFGTDPKGSYRSWDRR